MVSILVFVEDAREGDKPTKCLIAYAVSILVFVEDAREERKGQYQLYLI